MTSAGSFRNPLPGIPVVESPFFERLIEGFSDEERRVATDLHQRGYAVIDFPERDRDRIFREIVESLDGRYEWAKWRGGGYERGDGLRIQDAWKLDVNVKRIACNPSVLALLSKLYGRRALPFQTLNFPVGTQQAAHTDCVHFSSVPERFMCGVWVAFEDTDDDNGALFYYPGSHSWPIYLNEHLGVDAIDNRDTYEDYPAFLDAWRSLAEASGVAPAPFHARKGQAVIWAANLLHGGMKQRDPSRTRHSQVTHYYFEGCCYWTPLRSDPFYGRIKFDGLVDISTGESVGQTYAGREVPEWFLTYTHPDARTQPSVEFDPEAYLAANPDVRAGGLDPWEHYQKYGRREGRRLR